MPLTMAQIALIDILSDRAISLITSMKAVPDMTDEEVNAEKAKWESMSDSEMDRLNSH